jgi:SAM-dependent methyltransferase
MPANHPLLFDADAALRAQMRARRLDGDRFLERIAAEGMADRLGAITRSFTHGMWVGPGVHRILEGFAQRWDLARFGPGEELVHPPGEYDLAVCLFSLQTVNDLPGALVQIRRALKPDGLFLAAMLGGGTLKELREAFAHGESATRGGISPRVSPFVDVRDAGALLQRAGFTLPVADVERLLVRYGDFFALARDLRIHGFTNVLAQRSRVPLRRDTLNAMLSHYVRYHGDPDGRIRARFETLFLTGWTAHESQQKPLRPGSAKRRLAEALGTEEQVIESHPRRS